MHSADFASALSTGPVCSSSASRNAAFMRVRKSGSLRWRYHVAPRDAGGVDLLRRRLGQELGVRQDAGKFASAAAPRPVMSFPSRARVRVGCLSLSRGAAAAATHEVLGDAIFRSIFRDKMCRSTSPA
jgi:hypothetical protein